MYHCVHKHIKQHRFNTDDNNKCILSTKKKKKNTLEGFPKDHVTMKTGVMTEENSALPSQG